MKSTLLVLSESPRFEFWRGHRCDQALHKSAGTTCASKFSCKWSVVLS